MKTFYKYISLLISLAAFSNPGFAAVESLVNGSFLDSEQDIKLPRQSVVMVFPGGPALIDKKLQGTTEIITDLLAEGPSSMQADDYRRALFLNSAEIKVYSSLRAMFVLVKAPVAKLQDAIDLAAKTLAEPRLDQKSYENSYGKIRAQTQQSFEDMQSVVFFYGMRRATLDNADIYDGSGSPATVKNITFDAVKNSYARIFDKKHLYFVSSGPAKASEVAAALNKSFLSAQVTPKFAALPGRDIDPSSIMRKSPKGVSVTIIDKPGSTDNQLLFIYPEIIKRAAREEVVANVAHGLLGGGMSGRLGKTLRKERGLTYHAGSFVSQPGWMIYTFGGDDQVVGLLNGTKEVVAGFKSEKLSDQEVAEVKSTMDNKYRQNYELPGDVLLEKIKLRLFSRDEQFISKYQDLLKSVSLKDVRGFVSKKINTSHGQLFLMGDATKLKAALKKAGFDPTKAGVVGIDQVM